MTTITAPAATLAASFLIERRTLADALKPMCKVVEKRNTVPILAAVMMTVRADRVELRGTDLDVELAVTLACEDAAPGVALIDAHALKACVAKLKGTRVRLSVMGASVAVSDVANGMTTRLPLIDREENDWPIVPGAGVAGMTMPANQLRDDIGRALVAVSHDETRYYLKGIYVHTATDAGARVLRMATTDGHRLVRITRPIPEDAGDNLAKGAIWPHKACALAAMLIGKGGGEAALALSPTAFTFAYGNAVMTGKLVDGTFPDYSRVIPTSNPRGFDIAADQLADLAAGVTAHCGKNGGAIALAFNRAGWMTATAIDPDAGRAAVAVHDIAVTSPDADTFGTGIRGAYLVALAAKAFGAGTVSLRWHDASAPILATCDATPHVIAVQMPVRVDGGWLNVEEVAALNGTPAPAAAVEPVETPEHVEEPAPATVEAPEPVATPDAPVAADPEPAAANDDDAPAAAAGDDGFAAFALDYFGGVWTASVGPQRDRKARNRGVIVVTADRLAEARAAFAMPSPCPEHVEPAPAVMPSPCPRDDSPASIAARLAAVEVALGIVPAARPARTPAHLRAIRAYLRMRADRAAARADAEQARTNEAATRQRLQAQAREQMRMEDVIEQLRGDVVTAEVASKQSADLVVSLTAELTEERAALARLAPVVAAMEALHRPALAAAA